MAPEKDTTSGTRSIDSRPGFNYQMCVLSAIGICFVVLGHIKNDSSSIGTFFGWFPYYTFHMPLFLFITGYFFRDQYETRFFRSFGKFLVKKCKTLVLPFYIINSAFLILSLILEHWGYTPEYHYRFLEWLVSPFIYTQPATFAIPTWYLMALFFTEIFYIFLRKGVSLLLPLKAADTEKGTDSVPLTADQKTELVREILVLIITMLIGIAAIWFRNTHVVSEAAIVYLRSAAMLFFIQLGRIYRCYLEPHDQLPSLPYFGLVFLCQFLLIVLSHGSPMSPGLYQLVDFDRTGILYILTGITGIALWLRVSRIIASAPKPSRFITFVGKNTRDIMAFHPFGFFLLNTVFYFLIRLGAAQSVLAGFQTDLYRSRIYYLYTDNPRFVILYFAAGMGFSFLMIYLIRKIRGMLRKRS